MQRSVHFLPPSPPSLSNDESSGGDEPILPVRRVSNVVITTPHGNNDPRQLPASLRGRTSMTSRPYSDPLRNNTTPSSITSTTATSAQSLSAACRAGDLMTLRKLVKNLSTTTASGEGSFSSRSNTGNNDGLSVRESPILYTHNYDESTMLLIDAARDGAVPILNFLLEHRKILLDSLGISINLNGMDDVS